MTVAENSNPTPPYVPFKTFTGVIQTFKANGIPTRFDSTTMPNMSGSAQSQMKLALQFLGFADAQGNLQASLKPFVDSHGTSQWKTVLADLISEAYSDVIGDVNLDNATQQELQDRFRAYGDIKGSTLTRAVRFYLAAQAAAGVQLSKYFRAPSAGTRNSSRTPRNATQRSRRARKATAEASSEVADQSATGDYRTLLLEKFPELDPSWPDEIKTKWFESYERLLTIGREGK